MNAGILLLAAGLSRRFGADKRFARLGDGRGVLAASAGAALASGLPVRVCLQPGDRCAQALLGSLGAEVLYCAGAFAGMGCTIAEGMVQLPPWDGVLIALGDMPFVRADTYRAVAAGLSADVICRPCHRGRPGHPVGFGRTFFAELQALQGDAGARDILRAHPRSLRLLETGDGGVLRDIDTPADLG